MFMLRYITLCFVFVESYNMLCYVMFCLFFLRYNMLCYVYGTLYNMSCYVL